MRVLKERPASIETFTTSWRPSDGASRTTSVVQRRGTQPARVLPRAHRHWTPVQEECGRAVRLESAHAQPSQRLAPHTARAVRACPDARRVKAPTERLVGRPRSKRARLHHHYRQRLRHRDPCLFPCLLHFRRTTRNRCGVPWKLPAQQQLPVPQGGGVECHFCRAGRDAPALRPSRLERQQSL